MTASHRIAAGRLVRAIISADDPERTSHILADVGRFRAGLVARLVRDGHVNRQIAR